MDRRRPGLALIVPRSASWRLRTSIRVAGALSDAAFLFEGASSAHAGDLVFEARGSPPIGVVFECATT